MIDQTISLNQIDITGRLRALDEDWAQAIAASIEVNGLLEPLVVRAKGDAYQLVAGMHRYRALEILEKTQAPVRIVEMSDAHARLAEIDENLMRREVGALDRAIFLAERKAVYDELHPETRKGGDRKSDDAKIKAQTLRFDTFTEEASEKVGLSQRSIQDAIALVKRLAPEAIEMLRGSEIDDNASQLKALSRLESEEQIAIANLICEGKVKSVAEGKAHVGGAPAKDSLSPKDQWNAKMRSHWAQGDKRWQKAFLAEIGAEFK